jgi:hypothetical protein
MEESGSPEEIGREERNGGIGIPGRNSEEKRE